MLARVHACAVIGLDGVIVQVEVTTASGLPRVAIVGLPDAAVQESRERVEAAIKNAGLYFPRGRIVVNLAPAAVRKAGPAYDLPIAMGILIATDQLPTSCVEGAMMVGELSLDGTVRHVRGILPMAAAARAVGLTRFFCASQDAAEAALIPELSVYPVGSLQVLFSHLNGTSLVAASQPIQLDQEPSPARTDFLEVKGQEHVKRALEVAAAGMHNALLKGPPGSGKTLLAKAIPGILPRLQFEEALDVTRVYSVADRLPAGVPLVRQRPFRSPHHTISYAGLVGGGNWPHPGEISLAHRGVLFLDELPEFSPRVLEALRQPLEDKAITISRAQGSVTFPASFMLVAAMNPCPCGYLGDPVQTCRCSETVVHRYQRRISGPLLDRIDIHVEVPRVDYEKLSDERQGEPSEGIRGRIEQARARQAERFSGEPVSSNAGMSPALIRRYCRLDSTGKGLMKTAMQQLHLSARAYHRVLKLARSIADLAQQDSIEVEHLAEALQYRSTAHSGFSAHP